MMVLSLLPSTRGLPCLSTFEPRSCVPGPRFVSRFPAPLPGSDEGQISSNPSAAFAIWITQKGPLRHVKTDH